MSNPRPNLIARLCEALIEERILKALRARPNSSLLAIMLEVRPDFSDLSDRKRASSWFSLKKVLDELTAKGVLSSSTAQDGVEVWAVKQDGQHAVGNRTDGH